MDDVLLQRIKDEVPDFNHDVANGLAHQHSKQLMNYTRRVIEVNLPLWPKGIRFEEVRYSPPRSHFRLLAAPYPTKRSINIARSDTYLVDYQFYYNDVKLAPRPVLLPFIREGSWLNMNGAQSSVAAVLADIGYSVQKGSIFIPFRRSRLQFYTASHHFYENGTQRIGQYVWSKIHHELGKRKQADYHTRRLLCTSLPHYYFAMWGVTETFKRWANADVKVGQASDFPESQYPKKEWTRCESLPLKGKHPAGNTVILIPNHQNTELTKQFVAAFYYILDNYPGRFIDANADQSVLWCIILGNIIHGDFEHQGHSLEKTEKHLASLANELDLMTRDDLRSAKVYVDDIWELFFELQTSLLPLFYNTAQNTSMYGRLEVLSYLASEFNYAISMLTYAFQQRSDHNWTVDELNDLFKRQLKVNTFIKNFTKSPLLESISFSGDNKLFRVSSNLIPQDSAGRGSSHSIINDPSRLLHASIAAVAQYKNQTKPAPDGRGRINPWVKVTNGFIDHKHPYRDLIDETQARFEAK